MLRTHCVRASQTCPQTHTQTHKWNVTQRVILANGNFLWPVICSEYCDVIYYITTWLHLLHHNIFTSLRISYGCDRLHKKYPGNSTEATTERTHTSTQVNYMRDCNKEYTQKQKHIELNIMFIHYNAFFIQIYTFLKHKIHQKKLITNIFETYIYYINKKNPCMKV